jgi:dihydroorotase
MKRAHLGWLAMLFLSTNAATVSAQAYDLVIVNGRVIDPESGLDGIRHVGIRGDRVAAISETALAGRATIDARGLIVSPGFIDLHRHGHGDNSYRYQVRDGVTTSLELEVGTADVDAWYRQFAPGRLVNYGVAAGHIPARMRVLGDSGVFLPTGAARGAATVPQMLEIVGLVERGLAQGAVAVGMGLAYTPEASAMEVLQTFRAAAKHHAPVHIHLRGGMSSLIEAIGVAAIAHAPLHVVHVNSTGGANVTHFLQAIDDARRNGLDVTTEAYPYTAGATRIESALYDNWERWPDARFQSLQWAATGERLTRETFRKYRAQGGSVISHSNTEEALVVALASPLAMIASDGGRSERDEPTHPRASGTFARVLGKYAREQGTLTMREALRKMTVAPARRLEGRVPEMKDRGRIRIGAFADITVFDSARVIDRSSYENAAVFSEGIRHVIVNGTPVVHDGAIVAGRAPGRPIRATTR